MGSGNWIFLGCMLDAWDLEEIKYGCQVEVPVTEWGMKSMNLFVLVKFVKGFESLN